MYIPYDKIKPKHQIEHKRFIGFLFVKADDSFWNKKIIISLILWRLCLVGGGVTQSAPGLFWGCSGCSLFSGQLFVLGVIRPGFGQLYVCMGCSLLF